MRIAIFSEAYAPQVNGVVRTQLELVEYLRTRGHEVLLGVPHHKSNRPDPKVIAFKCVPFPLYPEMPIILPHWNFHRREFEAVAAFNPDLVHVMSPGVLGYFAQRWARQHRCHVVASYETDVLRYVHYYGFGFGEPLLLRYLHWLYNHCQRTYVPSRITMDQLIQVGIRNLRVFERGVDCDHFHPRNRSDAMRESYGVKPGGALVLYAGRLSKEKSLDVLLKSFTRVAAEIPAARLVIAGDGPFRRSLAKSFNSPAIIFTSWKHGQELAALIASADVLAVPSSTETLSLISLESMASGVPVLAMNAGGVREIVADQRTGILANSSTEFEGALRRLLQDSELRTRLGSAGRSYAVSKSWTRACEALVQDYFEILGQPVEIRPT
jgi:glycosyltransferase involved in cell wall biosynthesis